MSVTQYIGARYVPLFADPLAWDIMRQYEPLTIVYYQGNSYTSRQAVPAGIDITNTDYWALTGNYNAQIEQYRAEVQTYDDRITANTSSNTAQDAQLAGTSASGLKTLIDVNTTANTAQDAQLAGTSSSGLKTLIDANTSANTAQDAQLAGASSSGLKTLIEDGLADLSSEMLRPYYGMKSIGFGDSNMEGSNLGTPETECWYAKLCASLGCTYDNRGVSGARFYLSASNVINTQVNNATADPEVRLVCVMGGINDYHYEDISSSTFQNSVQTTVQNIKSKFINATVVLLMDCGSQDPSANLLRFASRIERVAFDNDCIVVPTCDMAFMAGYWMNQNHYTTGGTSFLAKRVEQYLAGNNGIMSLQRRTVVSPEEGFTGCRALVRTWIDLDKYIRHDDLQVFFDTSFTSTESTIASNTAVFMLPMGFDQNQASGAYSVYAVMNAVASGSIVQVPIYLYQAPANFTSLTESPVMQFRIQYGTPSANIAGKRTMFTFHNICLPLSIGQ